MKKLIYTVLATLIISVSVNAQENKNVQKETVTKKVTVKDTKVGTKVVQEVKEDNEVVKVEGTTKQDQDSQVVTSKSDKTEKVVADDVSIDVENAEKMQQNMNRKSAELKASIAAQRAKAEKERQMLQEKKMNMQKSLKNAEWN